jgi:transcriptional regulator with XRE-family HTH domain
MENRIAELRKARGLTLKALAERIGTSNQQISHLEKGRRRLTLDWMERTAIALHCEPFDLVSDRTRPEANKERQLIALFRALSEHQQDACLQFLAAFAGPDRDGA